MLDFLANAEPDYWVPQDQEPQDEPPEETFEPYCGLDDEDDGE